MNRRYFGDRGQSQFSGIKDCRPPVSAIEEVFRYKYLSGASPEPWGAEQLRKQRHPLVVQPPAPKLQRPPRRGGYGRTPQPRNFAVRTPLFSSGDWGRLSRTSQASSPPRQPRTCPIRPDTNASSRAASTPAPTPQQARTTPRFEDDSTNWRQASPTAPAAVVSTPIPLVPPPPSPLPSWGHNRAKKIVAPRGLSERVSQLRSLNANIGVWIVVETCRDCAQHDASLRHDEHAYIARFLQLQDAVSRCFPKGVKAELLVPKNFQVMTQSTLSKWGIKPAREESTRSAAQKRQEPSTRIGSFEVFLVCSSPLVLNEGTPLAVPGNSDTFMEFNYLCLASKLRTRTWPLLEAVMTRMFAAMPIGPVTVSVQTAMELPLPGVHVCITAGDPPPGSPLAQDSDFVVRQAPVEAETDSEGIAEIMVQYFVPQSVGIEQDILVQRQTRTITAVEPYQKIRFATETVVQLWQLEKPKEMIIFSSSPRVARGLHSCTGFLPFPTLPSSDNISEVQHGYVPFQGHLELTSSEVLRADSQGCIRWQRDPLQEAELLDLPGWRSARVCREAASGNGTGRLVEICRLGVPVAEVQLIAGCCGAPIPDAQIMVDGEVHGGTGLYGVPVSCGLKCGDHQVQVIHPLVMPDGMTNPLSITSEATCGVQLPLSPSRLRFVCVAPPGVTTDISATADLYLVAGDLTQWRCSHGAPPLGAEIWLWDGHLRGCPELVAEVQAGAVHWATKANGEHCGGDGKCLFAESLLEPVSSYDPWHITVHPARRRRECVFAQLARLISGGSPALWLGQLEVDGSSPRHNRNRPRVNADECARLSVRMQCCMNRFSGIPISINGVHAGETDRGGNFSISQERCDGATTVRVALGSLPPSVLPGWSAEFHINVCQSRTTLINLPVACMVWVFYTLPEQDSNEPGIAEDPSSMDDKGMVWVCADSEQVPEEAMPLNGRIECDLGGSGTSLDGTSVGPFLLAPGELPAGCCAMSSLRVVPDSIDGFVYQAREPSPLLERQQELGGCEMQRLCGCATVVGHLVPIRERDYEASSRVPSVDQLRPRTIELGSASRWDDIPSSSQNSRRGVQPSRFESGFESGQNWDECESGSLRSSPQRSQDPKSPLSSLVVESPRHVGGHGRGRDGLPPKPSGPGNSRGERQDAWQKHKTSPGLSRNCGNSKQDFHRGLWREVASNEKEIIPDCIDDIPISDEDMECDQISNHDRHHDTDLGGACLPIAGRCNPSLGNASNEQEPVHSDSVEDEYDSGFSGSESSDATDNEALSGEDRCGDRSLEKPSAGANHRDGGTHGHSTNCKSECYAGTGDVAEIPPHGDRCHSRLDDDACDSNDVSICEEDLGRGRLHEITSPDGDHSPHNLSARADLRGGDVHGPPITGDADRRTWSHGRSDAGNDHSVGQGKTWIRSHSGEANPPDVNLGRDAEDDPSYGNRCHSRLGDDACDSNDASSCDEDLGRGGPHEIMSPDGDYSPENINAGAERCENEPSGGNAGWEHRDGDVRGRPLSRDADADRRSGSYDGIRERYDNAANPPLSPGSHRSYSLDVGTEFDDEASSYRDGEHSAPYGDRCHSRLDDDGEYDSNDVSICDADLGRGGSPEAGLRRFSSRFKDDNGDYDQDSNDISICDGDVGRGRPTESASRDRCISRFGPDGSDEDDSNDVPIRAQDIGQGRHDESATRDHRCSSRQMAENQDYLGRYGAPNADRLGAPHFFGLETDRRSCHSGAQERGKPVEPGVSRTSSRLGFERTERPPSNPASRLSSTSRVSTGRERDFRRGRRSRSASPSDPFEEDSCEGKSDFESHTPN